MIRLWMRLGPKDGKDVEAFDAVDAIALLEKDAPSVAVVETENHVDFFAMRDALADEQTRKQKASILASIGRPSFETYAEQGIAPTPTGWRIILRRCRIQGNPKG